MWITGRLSWKGQPEVLGVRKLFQCQRVHRNPHTEKPTLRLNTGVHGEKTATDCLMTVPLVVVTILRRFIPVVVFLAVQTHTQMKYIFKFILAVNFHLT